MRNTINLLLKTAQDEVINNDLNDAVLSAATWALVQLTDASDNNPYTIHTFTETEREYLHEIAMDKRRDAYARMRSALILSASGSEKNVFYQADWLYEWAIVADGIKPHKELTISITLDHSENIDTLKILINSNLPMQAKWRVAIEMGRLGYFVPEMVEPLLQLIQDGLFNSDRNEALVYLVFIGGDRVASSLAEKINSFGKDEGNKDSYYFHSCCVLALIAIGNVSAIKYQLNL